MAWAEDVRGNTGCLFLRGNSIPFYRLGKKEWILIDSGSAYDREELFSYLREYGIIIKAVLCSHAHFDHVENCRALRDIFGSEIIMSDFDAGAVRDGVSLKSCFYSHTSEENRRFNGEMIVRADRIFCPDEEVVSACGVKFQIIPLPGHAASHVGFVTPDGAAYLADSLFGPRELSASKLVYMLSWRESIETMRRLSDSSYDCTILAHSGVCADIKGIAQENADRLEGMLKELYSLFESPLTLEELVKKVVSHYGYHVKKIEKARLFERITRAMAEALLEEGKLGMELKDGIVVYVPER